MFSSTSCLEISISHPSNKLWQSLKESPTSQRSRSARRTIPAPHFFEERRSAISCIDSPTCSFNCNPQSWEIFFQSIVIRRSILPFLVSDIASTLACATHISDTAMSRMEYCQFLQASECKRECVESEQDTGLGGGVSRPCCSIRTATVCVTSVRNELSYRLVLRAEDMPRNSLPAYVACGILLGMWAVGSQRQARQKTTLVS